MPFRDGGLSILGCVLTLIVPVYVCLGLRLYVRTTMKHIGADDWCMAMGGFFMVGLTAVTLAGAWEGIGVHEWDLTAKEKLWASMWFTMFSFWFFATVLCTKLAIAFLLCRVANGQRRYTHALHACIALFTTVITGGCIYLGLHCQPFAFNWDKNIEGGVCLDPKNVRTVYYVVSITNITTNWFCALLPIPLLWNIQMDMKNKISVLACLSLGFFASIAALIRLRYIGDLRDEDHLYHSSFVCVWSYAEVGIGIFAGSMATLRPLLERVFKKRSFSQSTQHRVARISIYSTHDQAELDSKAGRRASVAPGAFANVKAVSRKGTEVGRSRMSSKMGSIAGIVLANQDQDSSSRSDHGGIMVSYDVQVAHGDVRSKSVGSRKASESGW